MPSLLWIDQAQVKTLMADTAEAEASPPLEKAAVLLLAHSIAKVETIWTKDPVFDALSGERLDWADLIVAGTHARRVLDFIRGSIAFRLIDQHRNAELIVSQSHPKGCPSRRSRTSERQRAPQDHGPDSCGMSGSEQGRATWRAVTCQSPP